MSRHGWNGGIRNGTLGAFLTQAGAAALVAGALAGCSAIPDDAKPSPVYGQTKPAEAQPGSNSFPDLAKVPSSAPAATPKDQQEDIARSLAADRAAAKQTDDALRTGSTTAPQPVAATPAPAPAPVPAPAMTAPAAAPVPTPPPAVKAPAPVKAPVAAPAATPAPTPVPAPVKPSAPVTKPAAVKAPAPAVTPPAATPPALPEPAAMAPMNEAPAAPEKKLNLEPGVIPVPARGGHKTLEEARGLPPAKDAPAAAAEPAEEKPDPNAEQPVNAAPTTPVEVKPTVGGGK